MYKRYHRCKTGSSLGGTGNNVDSQNKRKTDNHRPGRIEGLLSNRGPCGCIQEKEPVDLTKVIINILFVLPWILLIVLVCCWAAYCNRWDDYHNQQVDSAKNLAITYCINEFTINYPKIESMRHYGNEMDQFDFALDKPYSDKDIYLDGKGHKIMIEIQYYFLGDDCRAWPITAIPFDRYSLYVQKVSFDGKQRDVADGWGK